MATFSVPVERGTCSLGVICHTLRNRHQLWKQKAVCNDAPCGALINKSGLDTICVVLWTFMHQKDHV